MEKRPKNIKSQKKKRRRKSYVNGWVEFTDKSAAEKIASALNNRPIGGTIKNRYRDDLWSLRFLPDFQWRHMVEQLQYRHDIKGVKIREAMSEAKKEEKFYRKKVALAKLREKEGQGPESAEKYKKTFKQSFGLKNYKISFLLFLMFF